MKTFSLLIIIIFFVSFRNPANCQKITKDEEKAIEAFDLGEYAEAIELYRVAYAKSSPARKAEIVFRTGICYMKLNEPKSAEQWFRKAIQVKYPDPICVLYHADAMKMNGKFEEAMAEYQRYKKLVPNDPRADIGVESCKLAAEWKNNPTRYQVENMTFFNDRARDFSPVYAKGDYKTIYFSSNREGSKGNGTHKVTGAGFFDLWSTTIDRKGKWSVPTPIEGETINTEDDEGASSLNLKGNTLYFTRCRVEKRKIMGCQIYTAKKKGVAWGDPEMIVIPGATDSSSYGYPAINADDNVLYFSARLHGGYGGLDIWKITREKSNKPWGEPINLGPEINSPGNEVFPYERLDGTLYFSSDYWAGMGGLDIFKAKKDESGKYVIENMKYPINTEADDFGIIFEGNKERGFFTSSRKGGKGLDDIYEFYLPPLEFYVTGIVYNKKTNRKIPGAKVILKGSNADTKEITTQEMITEADGSYKFKLDANTDYRIEASMDKFLNGQTSVSTVGIEVDKTFKEDIYLDPIDTVIRLNNIFYEFTKWNLLPESMVELDHLVEILNLNPKITIELMSHTDFRGSNESNLELSQKRAQSVVDYLISKGISPDRLVAKGYGEEVPAVVDSATAARYRFLPEGQKLTEEFIKSLSTVEEQEVAHQINRRTEFKVLRTDYQAKPEGILNEEENNGENNEGIE
ncbi:MAG: OmpA family protein [Marinilabiliales bacterium]